MIEFVRVAAAEHLRRELYDEECGLIPWFLLPGGVEQQVPPLRYPGFPVELGGVWCTSCALLYGRAHTWSCQ